MKRKLYFIIILFILFVIYIYVANITLFPKSILLLQGEKIDLATLWGIKLSENNSNSNTDNYLENLKNGKTLEASSFATNTTNGVGKIDLSLNLFNIPVGEVSVNVLPKTKVVPLRKCNWTKTIY